MMSRQIISIVTCLMVYLVSGQSCSAQTGEPSDPDATLQTRALYRNLMKLKGQGIMFGHQDTLAYGIGWKGDAFNSDVYRVCGKFPAVLGWDLGHIGDSNNIDGVPFTRMQQWIKLGYEKNAVSTLSWHMRVPGSKRNAWTREKIVPRILPGGDLHQAYVERLDHVAAFLADLKNDEGEPIPVVFRPFHEHNGSWFWWGAGNCTVDEYKQLWRFTVNYLREDKGLHHLLTCYSTDVFRSEEEYLERYPGDDIIDVLGFDDYKSLRTLETQEWMQSMIKTVVTLAEQKHKLAVLSEGGMEKLPESTWWTRVLLPNLKANDISRQLSWVLVWRNGRPDHFYAPYPGQPSAEDFKAFVQDDLILLMEDLTEMYQ